MYQNVLLYSPGGNWIDPKGENETLGVANQYRHSGCKRVEFVDDSLAATKSCTNIKFHIYW